MKVSAAMSFESVHLAYKGEAPILQDLNFSIFFRERVALVGLNGSGKTTLLKACVGLVPHTGYIRVGEVTLSEDTLAQVREQIGFLFNVPENQLLFPKVDEDVAFTALRKKVPQREAFLQAQQTLQELGIGHLADQPLHHLSHGQKQRVALAGVLVGKPDVLLLDEPTSGLDPIGKNRLENILERQTAAMLIATHDLDFAERFCSRCLFLEDRELKNGWSLSDIRSHWSDPKTTAN